MAVRGVDPDEEKKSYGTVFFVGSILLVVVSLWAVSTTTSPGGCGRSSGGVLQTDYERAAAALAKEQQRLDADPKYSELVRKRDAELQSLAGGEKGAKLA